MNRIIIIGSPGSGKSTLSKIVARKLQLPLVHLDKLFWKDGWTETPKEVFDGVLKEILARERWLVDGNYGRTLAVRMQSADTVVFLDYPRRTCVYRVLKRVLTSYGESRSDMGANCPERIDLSFLKYVWNFPKTSRGKIVSLLEHAEGKTIIVIHNEEERKAFLASLEESAGKPADG